jgi:glycosyltransferase involved in cell wall biosynthesis
MAVRHSISLIIPAFKAARTIGAALHSALVQTLPPDEILIVDDGSPDDIAGAVEPHPSVKVLRKTNGGAASARNLGIEHANGDLIAFLDADDTWEPSKLERQVEVLERFPQVGLIASRYFEQVPGEPRTAPGPTLDPFTGRLLFAERQGLVEIVTRIWTSTAVVRREALGKERFESGLEPAEDRDLWIRLAAARPAYILPERLATAGLVPDSLSRSHVDRDRSNMLRVIDRHQALLGHVQQQTWRARVFRAWAAEYLGVRRPQQALPPAWNRLRRQPFSLQAWYIFLKSAALSAYPG